MPYTDGKTTNTNIDYLNKDFDTLKSSLVDYAKAYFPNTYRDFNETSPGMMLLEMSAYVGDVLSFYIDSQYKEMLLPMAEERRNVVNLAKMMGYKVSSIVPSYAELQFTCEIDAYTDAEHPERDPNWSQANIIEKGAQVSSLSNSNIIFETTVDCDFTENVSGSMGVDYFPASVNSDGLIESYTLVKKVPSVSGQTTTKSFSIGPPIKFLRLNLEATNVTEILKVEDGNGQKWYEVDYLAQDKVPKETFYFSDPDRQDNESNANQFYDPIDDEIVDAPIPYTLEFIRTTKRFITETNEDNTTSLVFGNGILRNGQTIGTEVYNTEQAGMLLPGSPTDYATDIDPMLNDVYGTLGEAPSNTTLTVTYRVGGGLQSNVSSKDITTLGNYTLSKGGSLSNAKVSNPEPARGGADVETVEEIRQRARSNFATQNRVVTKKDYEARTLAMPPKFGSIAKVYAGRIGNPDQNIDRYNRIHDIISAIVTNYQNGTDFGVDATHTVITDGQINPFLDLNDDGSVDSTDLVTLQNWLNLNSGNPLATIELYLLSYNIRKDLVDPSSLLVQNLTNYLENYKILTDDITVMPGYIINFGVIFDVLAQPGTNKQQLKLECISKIRKYFQIEKMQFNQPIYTSAVESALMEIEDIRAINFVKITQEDYYLGTNRVIAFENPLYNQDGSNGAPSEGAEYQWRYNFNDFYADGNGQYSSTHGDGVILPSRYPAVFELKNPNQNIKGVVR